MRYVHFTPSINLKKKSLDWWGINQSELHEKQTEKKYYRQIKNLFLSYLKIPKWFSVLQNYANISPPQSNRNHESRVGTHAQNFFRKWMVEFKTAWWIWNRSKQITHLRPEVIYWNWKFQGERGMILCGGDKIKARIFVVESRTSEWNFHENCLSLNRKFCFRNSTGYPLKKLLNF